MKIKSNLIEYHAQNLIKTVFKVTKNKIVQEVEALQLRDDLPEFSPGDTVVVQIRVVEGLKTISTSIIYYQVSNSFS